MGNERCNGERYRIHKPTAETKKHAKKVLADRLPGEEVQLTGHIWAIKVDDRNINYYETY